MAKKGKKAKKDVAVVKKSEEKKKLKDPDPESEDYIYDAVDKFHNQSDKILLDAEKQSDSDDLSEEEQEEVFGLTSDEDEDEEEEEEDDEEEENFLKSLPNDKAWGRGKKAFYNADVSDEDVYANDEEATQVTAEEEKEAISLQQRLHEKLHEDDFQSFYEPAEEPAESKEKEVVKDLSSLSKRERMELFVKESPEFLGLVDEFSERMNDVISTYQPLMELVTSGKIPSQQGREYIKLKHSLLLNYCVNLSFYFQLKASKERVTNHPVIERIVQHKELLKKLEPLDARLKPEMDKLVAEYEAAQKMTAVKEKRKKVKTGTRKIAKEIGNEIAKEIGKDNSEKTKKKRRKRKKKSQFEDDDSDGHEIDPLEYYNQIKAEVQAKKAKKPDMTVYGGDDNPGAADDADDDDGKRKITYEMQKNKGLTRSRKKELRNPRIKHKIKFSKAKIKHKSQVREVVTEMRRYGGEATGIKSGLARSVKLKS